MIKRSIVLFSFLFAFFIILSGFADLQHIIIGGIISLLTIWFWKDISYRLPSILSIGELLALARSMAMLIGYVIKSNIDVAKILLFSKSNEASIFLELEPGLESNWGRVLLATCITITPGTITVDIDPETNVFTIHALNLETGRSLYYWRIITEIKNLEGHVKRREKNALDIYRLHGFNSLDSLEGNPRAYSN